MNNVYYSSFFFLFIFTYVIQCIFWRTSRTYFMNEGVSCYLIAKVNNHNFDFEFLFQLWKNSESCFATSKVFERPSWKLCFFLWRRLWKYLVNTNITTLIPTCWPWHDIFYIKLKVNVVLVIVYVCECECVINHETHINASLTSVVVYHDSCN